MSYYPGNVIWVPHEEKAWAKATILSVNGKTLEVRLNDASDEVMQVSASETEFLNEASGSKDYLIEDLTKLPDLHRPAILDTLDQRFQHDIIYTYTGHILIAMNPFKKIDGLYGNDVMDKFVNKDLGSHYEPHAYSSAHLAFLNMINTNGQNQSILVSGESGAGKTVTTKLVMDYLTAVSQYRSGDMDDSSRKVCNRVLKTNPMLESFGNAATLRNDNSSRFGKLIHLQFRPGHSTLIGAKIDIYLLEQARITSQQEGERNFHIFYELAAGLSAEEKREWMMPNLEDCNYTNQSDRMTRNDVDDKAQFAITLSAMQTVGFTKEEKDRVCKTVIAVLYLGNIEFEESTVNNEDGSKIAGDSKTDAQNACKLLGVNYLILERGLCSRSIVAGPLSSAKVTTPLRVEQANESRDALAAAIYHRLFLWIAWRANQSISVAKHSAQKRLSGDLKKLNQKMKGRLGGGFHNDYSISCLDIFGFEVFESNGFEQMCINYANEVLQSIFNEFVFKLEQKYYETEGIDWTKIEFPDNYATIEMIEGSPIGLLKIIDEECLYPKGNDDSMHIKFKSNLPKKYATFTVDPATQSGHNLFSIKHFAGDVEYSVGGFHSKNKNELRQEAVDLIRSSSDDLVRILLPPTASQASGAGSAEEYFNKAAAEATQANSKRKKIRVSIDRHRKRGVIQQRTVSAHFKDQLGEAMGHIRASKPHFVRCIKPNDLNISDELDRPRTIEQLNYSGVLEAVRIARAGYTSRFQLAEFLSRFHCLRPEKKKARGKDKEACLAILRAAKLTKFDDYQVGHTRVFLRAEAFSKLEALKRDMLQDSVVLIQRNIRTWLFRLHIEDKIRERKEREEEQRRLEEAKRREAEGIEETGPTKVVSPIPARTPVRTPRRKKKQRVEDFGTVDVSEFTAQSGVSRGSGSRAGRGARGGEFNNDDFQAALQKLLDVAKARIEPLLQGQQLDIDPQIVVITVAVLVLFIIMLASPVLFINVAVLGGLGYWAALQFRNTQLRAQERRRGRKPPKRRGQGRHRANKEPIMFSTQLGTTALRDDLWETASADSYETHGTRGTRRSKNSRHSRRGRGISQSQKKMATLPRPQSKRLTQKEKQGLKRVGSHRSLTKKASAKSLKRTPSGKFAPVKQQA